MGIVGTTAGITLVPGIGQLTSADGSIVFSPSTGASAVVNLSVASSGSGGFLKLDQTTPQTVINGIPSFTGGGVYIADLDAGSGGNAFRIGGTDYANFVGRFYAADTTIYITGSDDVAPANGVSFQFIAGAGNSGGDNDGGRIFIQGGHAAGHGNGGIVYIEGGAEASGGAGYVHIGESLVTVPIHLTTYESLFVEDDLEVNKQTWLEDGLQVTGSTPGRAINLTSGIETPDVTNSGNINITTPSTSGDATNSGTITLSTGGGINSAGNIVLSPGSAGTPGIIQIVGNLKPNNDSSRDIGDGTHRLKNIFANTWSDGTTNLTPSTTVSTNTTQSITGAKSFTTNNVTITDINVVLGTTTGTRFGTATNQKIGFFNATPIVQVANTTDLGTVLSNLGLRASGTAYPITTSGAVSFTGTIGLGGAVTVTDAKDFAIGTTTGTKIGTATNQKIGLWNAAPIVQPSSTGEVNGFTAGSSTAVLKDSTFTGNVGSTAYTISDIVKHLKNFGLIAA